MREVLAITQQVIDCILWLLEHARHLGLSFAASLTAAWPEGHLWKQIGFLVLIALLAYATFIVSRSVLKGMHYTFKALACLLALFMAIVPTLVVTFLALAGAIWIAKSF